MAKQNHTIRYVFGDIHGAAQEFSRLLDKIQAHRATLPAGTASEIILLGDLIDGGTGSADVMELAMTLPQRFAGSKIIYLWGNHERGLVDHYRGHPTSDKAMNWYAPNRGAGVGLLVGCGAKVPAIEQLTTAEQVVAAIRDYVPERYITFIEQHFQYHYSSGPYFFCHAGIMPDVPLSAQKDWDLMWIRSPFLEHNAPFEKIIVHGHTPYHYDNMRFALPNRLNLDTGAKRGHHLTCALLTDIYDPDTLSYWREAVTSETYSRQK